MPPKTNLDVVPVKREVARDEERTTKKSKFEELDEEREMEKWYAASAESKATFLAKLLTNGVSLADIYTKFNTDDRFFYAMCGIFVNDGDPDLTAVNTSWRFFTDEKLDLKDFDSFDYEDFHKRYTILKEHPLKFENFWDALDRIYEGEVHPATIDIDFTQDFEAADEGYGADLGEHHKRLCRIEKLYRVAQ